MSTNLFFAKDQTREGIQWVVRDKRTNGPINLTGATVTFTIKSLSDTVLVSGTATILSPASAGKCQYLPNAGDLDTKGIYYVDLKVTFPDGTIFKSQPQSMAITIVD